MRIISVLFGIIGAAISVILSVALTSLAVIAMYLIAKRFHEYAGRDTADIARDFSPNIRSWVKNPKLMFTWALGVSFFALPTIAARLLGKMLSAGCEKLVQFIDASIPREEAETPASTVGSTDE